MTYIILPCYNEEGVVRDTTRLLLGYLSSKSCACSLLYVDDGSYDGTWDCIAEMCRTYPQVRGLRLSHNVGQQAATLAGIEACVDAAEAVISMDVDLQDDMRVIPRMIEEYRKGAEVVYGVRRSRACDSLWKRGTASLFYRIMKAMGCELVYNHSEFRLLSQRAARALQSYSERNLFVRCIVPQLGFPSARVYYDRQPRTAGDTKYSAAKLARLALDGITNFSVRPIRWVQLLGCLCLLVALAVIIWALVNYVQGRTNQGWPSLLISLWMVGGLQILTVGIVGEYIGKIYTEVKRRPRYFVQEKTW